MTKFNYELEIKTKETPLIPQFVVLLNWLSETTGAGRVSSYIQEGGGR
jgi:hypothetical protein